MRQQFTGFETEFQILFEFEKIDILGRLFIENIGLIYFEHIFPKKVHLL